MISNKPSSPSENMPFISVLMPAFNAEKYIECAIKSILNQSYSNFELIILDDGSSDQTRELINQFSDSRIKKIYQDENAGLVTARNALVASASGKYIAFLDADDIAMPHRLEMQVSYLENFAVDICGSAYDAIYESSGKRKTSKQRYSDADIRALITIYSPLCNPAVMAKAEVFKKFPYEVGKDYAEDYSLWVRLSLAGYRFANLKARLITYRIHEKQTSQVQNSATNTIFLKSREQYLSGLGINPKLAPRALGFSDRLKIATPFLFKLNRKIPGVSIMANYEIYARFQFRGNGFLTPLIRLERFLISILASSSSII